MANPYVGQITAFAFPYAPANWAACDGSTVPLNQYGALYALIGNAFGGDGRSTIGLPNLGGASPCGTGAGPGLTPRTLGQSFGQAMVTLDTTTMPAHAHTANAAAFQVGQARLNVPGPASALTTASTINLYSDGAADSIMSPGSVSPSGAGAPHDNRQPYLGVNYCLALLGEFPSFP